MLWFQEPNDSFWIFQYGSFFFGVSAPYTFIAGETISDTPPPDYYEPISGFGMVWRGEIDTFGFQSVRERLGWAVELEHPYETPYQCKGGASYWDERCYIVGPHGGILEFGPGGVWSLHFVP